MKKVTLTEGRMAISTLIGGFVIAGLILFSHFVMNGGTRGLYVSADTATTTVLVLNTPPNWSVDAQEQFESSTSTPTNVGSNVSWVGTATDPNSDSYYLLICKTSSTPAGGVGGGAPTCGGGAGNQWAVSVVTPSGVQATSTYTAQSSDPMINPWFAWICDNNAGGAQCNGTYKQGTGNTASPFVVNHRPNFSSISNDGPKDPGGIITWTANASDTDNFSGTTDTVKLFVCKAADFTGSACGAAGTYCSSTSVLANPSCSSTLPVPDQDKSYNSYGYVLDNWSLAASGGAEGATSTYSVNNVAPSISSSSVSLLNTNGSGNLTLTTPSGQTSGFKVDFTVADNNSCLNASGGHEISSAITNVYRSGVGQAACQVAGDYNANSCYPAAAPTSTWNLFCSQLTCTGSSSVTADWECTFPLWYVADPTDGTLASDTQFFAQNWLASVRATDDNGATSSLVEGGTGNELASFLAAQLGTASINYGSLSPGAQNASLTASTTLFATGNVGLDETLYGKDMCPGYPTCSVSTTSTIPVGQEQYASSSLSYGSGIALLVNPGALFPIHIPKSTATSTQSSGITDWGIAVPGTIQLSGAYTGQNTFIGVKSPAQNW